MHREEPLWSEGDKPRDLAAEIETASQVAEAREAFGHLRDLVPEERRAILELKAEGLSSQEIGERLGISERTVQRVLEDLRRRVCHRGLDDRDELDRPIGGPGTRRRPRPRPGSPAGSKRLA